MKVGELARASGLTVRTLHHYDEIGLLTPARDTGGQRVYGGKDIRRLYRILGLRSLGLPLDEVAACLARDGTDPRAMVREHLRRVEDELDRQRQLHHRLTRILDALDHGGDAAAELFLRAMEAMTRMERYYTPEQLDQLARRRAELGDDAIRQAEQAWADLIAELEAERQAGTDPAEARVQALGRRWEELIERFTGGDEAIRRSLATMYEQEGVEAASRGSVSSELMAYAQRVIAAGRPPA